MVRKGSIGQAPALSKKLWKQWLQWLLDKAGARIYAIVLLTGAFGLRMGEALVLKAEDIDLQADIPKLRVTGDICGNRKSPGDVNLIDPPAHSWGAHLVHAQLAFKLPGRIHIY